MIIIFGLIGIRFIFFLINIFLLISLLFKIFESILIFDFMFISELCNIFLIYLFFLFEYRLLFSIDIELIFSSFNLIFELPLNDLEKVFLFIFSKELFFSSSLEYGYFYAELLFKNNNFFIFNFSLLNL